MLITKTFIRDLVIYVRHNPKSVSLTSHYHEIGNRKEPYFNISVRDNLPAYSYGDRFSICAYCDSNGKITSFEGITTTLDLSKLEAAIHKAIHRNFKLARKNKAIGGQNGPLINHAGTVAGSRTP